MDRRQFFRRAVNKGVEAATRVADASVNAAASHWIRPPFAIDELEFLLACTRCGACVAACPHQVIFPLAARLGARVMGTPALDLLNHGCHLCADWPCVLACEPGALQLPATVDDGEHEIAEAALPVLALARIEPGICLPYDGPECGACRDSCPVPGALCWPGERPVIDANLCVGCGLCREACITTPRAVTIHSRSAGRAEA